MAGEQLEVASMDDTSEIEGWTDLGELSIIEYKHKNRCSRAHVRDERALNADLDIEISTASCMGHGGLLVVVSLWMEL